MRDISDLVHKTISHKATLDSNRRDVKNNSILISKKSDELSGLNKLKVTTDTACDYLDALIKEESGKFVKKVNDILDYGVKTIFFDCDYSVEVRVSDTDRVSIHLVYEDEDGNKIEPDIKQVGGGVRSVIGCLLQFIFIYSGRVEPIVFIDEGLSQISSIYIPKLMAFISEMANKNSLKILLITHDNRFMPYATSVYEVSDGVVVSIDNKSELEVPDVVVSS